MIDVLQAMETRFSTRGYTEEKLTAQEIDALLKAGLQAPTAANKQEIHFTVVDGANPVLREIEEEMLKGRDKKPEKNFYYGAPTLFILSGDRNFGWSTLDAGIAVENMSLAAEGLGLGSLIIGCIKGAMNGERQAEFAQKLQLPENFQFEVALAVGHKAVTKEPHTYDYEKNVTIL